MASSRVGTCVSVALLVVWGCGSDDRQGGSDDVPNSDGTAGDAQFEVINGDAFADADGQSGDGQSGDGTGADGADGATSGDGANPDGADNGDGADAPDVLDPCVQNPGTFGCPCEENGDCNSSWCVPSRQGDQVCSQTCTESCPGDLSCRLVQTPGGDPVFLCVDLTVNLCKPCRANSDCQGGFGGVDNRCIPRSAAEGAYCGLGCSSDEACPDGYVCEEVGDVETNLTSKQCVPEDDAACTCSPRAVAEQASTACFNQACKGSRVCGEDGLSACDAPIAGNEECNGIDDNCNGSTDESFPNTDGDAAADCVDIDDDGDGHDDDDDNCPLIANPDQADADHDGIGDLCDPPTPPVLTETRPASPANDNAPVVLGKAEPGAQVTLYTQAGCGGVAIGTAVADANGDVVIAATVADDSLTSFYATTTDPANGLTSACSGGVIYLEDSTAPPVPVLTATDPVSPGATTTFVVVGSAEPGSTVSLWTDAACSQGGGAGGPSGVAAADGKFRISLTIQAGTSVTVYANAADAAGNVSGCSASITYVHDATAPAPPVFNVTIPASPSDDETSPVLVGKTEGGAKVAIYTTADCSGAPVETATAGPNGIFTAVVDVEPNSLTTFYGTATDAAGNVSACSPDGIEYIHDDQDPDAPDLVGTEPASPGSSTTPEVFGTAEPFALVRLYLGADCTGFLIGEVTADEAGEWSVSIAVAANAATYVYGRATDLAGRVSECTVEPLEYIHDGIAPAAPEVHGTEPASPATDRTPAVVGVAEPGSTVTVWLDADCSVPGDADGASGTAAEDGTYAVEVTVAANAATTLWTSATDAAGNESGCSATSTTYVHDDKAPDAPKVTLTRPESPASVIAPVVGGTAEAGATLEVYGDAGCAGAVLGTGEVDPDGTFSVTSTVAENAVTTLFARAIDAAGNISACSAPGFPYEHDDSQPLVPSFTGSDPTSPNNDTTQPTLKGEAEASSTVAIYTDADCEGTAVATTTATADGDFAVTVTAAANASTTFYARSTDSAGNPSPCSPEGLTYTHDDKAPAAPALTSSTPASPSNTSTTPTVRGSAEGNTHVTLYTDPGCTVAANVTADADDAGAWTAGVTAGANTTTTFYATATDAAGNVSVCSPGLAYTHDDAKPDAPILTGTDPASPALDLTPDVQGTAEAGTTVRVYASGDCSGSVVGQGTATGGVIDITAGAGPNQPTTFTATATDAAGNVSDCAAPITYVNDSQAPNKPVWTGTNPTSPNKTNTTPTLLGTGDPSVTVRLYTNVACTGAPSKTTTSDGTGAFSFAVTVTANTSTNYYADAVDAVGNVSACTNPLLNYTHDSNAPVVPTLGPITPASPSNEPKPDVKGKTEAGASVKLYASNNCSGAVVATLTADASGNVTFVDVTVTLNGTTQFSATATDAVGNVSACSTAISYLHDDIKPTAPTVTGTDPASPSSDPKPKVNGTVSENALTVKVYRTNNCTGTIAGQATLGATMAFGILSDANLNNTTSFYANATDAAGNVSACSTTFATYLHDSQAPNPPYELGTNPTPWSRTVSKPDVFGKAEVQMAILVYPNGNCTEPPSVTIPADATIDWTTPVEIGPADNNTAFTAKARDSAGNTSACSASVPYRYDKTVPTFAGATGAALGTDGTKQVNVSWAAGSDNFSAASALVYEVCISQKCGAADCDFTSPPYPSAPKYQLTTAGATTLLIDNLVANTRYYFKVRARDEVGNQETNDKVVGVKTQGLNSGIGLFVGENGSCLRLADGTRKCWGPTVPPTSGLTDPIQFSSGSAHSCAVERAGQVKCWGTNKNGQLGDNTTVDRTNAVTVSGITNAIQVDVGIEHSCALLVDGTVRCWGRNEQGQLGIGGASSTDQLVPVAVATTSDAGSPLNGVVSIAVGDVHGCAIRTDGSVWCWGSNTNGQGARPGGGASRFAVLSPSASNMLSMAAGQFHTCGLRNDGHVLCWGWNFYGQLGDGNDGVDSATPKDTGLTNAIALGSARLHTCAALSDGTARCWGQNEKGQIGDAAAPTIVDVPTQVVGLSNVAQVGGGAGFSCARLTDGTARCWGDGEGGRLGNGGTTGSTTPVLVTLPLGVAGVVTVSIDNEHVCALVADGGARCWGRNTNGQLAGGTTGPDASPLLVASSLTPTRAAETGATHSCFLTSIGTVQCSGANDAGQLGDGSLTSSPTPVTVTGLSGVRAIALGSKSTCATLVDGSVKCWGDNTATRLGISGDAKLPQTVAGITKVRSLAVGIDHVCASDTVGEVYCWGKNDKGQIDGTAAAGAVQTTPKKVPGLAGAIQVVAGGAHSCALMVDGTVRCWGDNAATQLGVTGAGTGIQTVTGQNAVVALSAGGRTTCALKLNGALQCWGSNAAGAIGNNTATPTFATPQNVTLPAAPNNRIATMSEGDDNACMATSTGLAYCWGDNDALALGNGATESTDSRTPSQVICLP